MNSLSSDDIHATRRSPGFTLVELLVVILIIVVLATLSFTGFGMLKKRVEMSTTLSNMRQLAAGTLLYAQEHNGFIPRGDDGADGAGKGGRGLIWINHIAPYVGTPKLETEALNQTRDGMDQWTYLLTRYKNAPFVCGGFDSEEVTKAKAKTPDAIGGIGYNVNPLSSATSRGPNNASWGNVSQPIPLARITESGDRCMYASSYDWHLVDSPSRAYNRFVNDKAAMVFWDGSSRLVNRTEYDRAIKNPEMH